MKSRDGLEKSDQIDRFKEAARQLETDESEAAFDEKLKILASQKVKNLKTASKSDTKGSRSKKTG